MIALVHPSGWDLVAGSVAAGGLAAVCWAAKRDAGVTWRQWLDLEPRDGGPRPTRAELLLGVAANWWHLCGEVCELVRASDAAERCYWRELEADVAADELARPARTEGREAFFGGDR